MMKDNDDGDGDECNNDDEEGGDDSDDDGPVFGGRRRPVKMTAGLRMTMRMSRVLMMRNALTICRLWAPSGKFVCSQLPKQEFTASTWLWFPSTWVASLTIHVVVGPVQDFAIEDMEHWGILRRFDPRQIAMDLISEGKTGWEPDDSKPSTENLSNFFLRYTLGRGDQPLTMQAKGLETRPQTYEATLVTCLSAEVCVGRGLSEMRAKRMAAAQFFRDEEMRKVFPLLPPTQAHIRSKAVLYTEEKRECKAHGVSPDAMRDIVARRIADVLECFHDMGYRTDIWDGNC
jgi:hypothetical protein